MSSIQTKYPHTEIPIYQLINSLSFRSQMDKDHCAGGFLSLPVRSNSSALCVGFSNVEACLFRARALAQPSTRRQESFKGVNIMKWFIALISAITLFAGTAAF